MAYRGQTIDIKTPKTRCREFRASGSGTGAKLWCGMRPHPASHCPKWYPAQAITTMARTISRAFNKVTGRRPEEGVGVVMRPRSSDGVWHFLRIPATGHAKR